MAREKNWSPSEQKLDAVLTQLHRTLITAGSAEARLVDDLMVEVLEPDSSIELRIDSLVELINWAQVVRHRLVLLKNTGR